MRFKKSQTITELMSWEGKILLDPSTFSHMGLCLLAILPQQQGGDVGSRQMCECLMQCMRFYLKHSSTRLEDSPLQSPNLRNYWSNQSWLSAGFSMVVLHPVISAHAIEERQGCSPLPHPLQEVQIGSPVNKIISLWRIKCIIKSIKETHVSMLFK